MQSINKSSVPGNLITPAVQALQAGQKIAMLTLIGIEGSAPYPLGSQMLVIEGGEFVGQITGGCAETALAEQALVCIREGQNGVERYGLDSPYFDIQLPCGSGIDVLFDVTTPLDSWLVLEQQLQARKPSSLVLEHGDISFERHYQPAERLVLAGQGPILIKLAELALHSGFDVVILAQDAEQLASLEAAGLAAQLLVNHADQLTEFADSYTGVVSLFHEHEREPALLQRALCSDVFYIGALGSKRTHAQRLATLRELGVADAALARIHGPVGLDIHAETPAQIAISILAEVIAKIPKQDASQT